MSVTVRPYRRGGWEVDIQWRAPNGRRHRERKRVSGSPSEDHSSREMLRRLADPPTRDRQPGGYRRLSNPALPAINASFFARVQPLSCRSRFRAA
jgi:hypothetical protein